MITFHCGFNKEQVEKLQNNEKIIFPKIPVDNIYVPRKNTFDYIPRYMYEDDSIKAREIKEYISNDMYIKTNVCNKDGMKQYMGMTSSHEILFESDIGGITNTNERMLMEQPHTINPKSRNPRLHVSIEPRTHQAHAFKETHAINIDKTYQR